MNRDLHPATPRDKTSNIEQILKDMLFDSIPSDCFRGSPSSSGVPHVRTSVRGPDTMGEAQPQPFVNTQIRVLRSRIRAFDSIPADCFCGSQNSSGVPHVRTSVRGPNTMGEAQPQPSVDTQYESYVSRIRAFDSIPADCFCGSHSFSGVPHVRTSVRGPNTMGEAQPQPSVDTQYESYVPES